MSDTANNWVDDSISSGAVNHSVRCHRADVVLDADWDVVSVSAREHITRDCYNAGSQLNPSGSLDC